MIGSTRQTNKPMVLLEEVVSAAKEVAQIHNKMEEIKDERKASNLSFKERLNPLEDRTKELEAIIIDYLLSNNMPAVKLGATVFFLETPTSYVTREEKIEDVLKSTPEGASPDTISKKIIHALKKRAVKKNNEEADKMDKNTARLRIVHHG